jgi:hypothetical protein
MHIYDSSLNYSYDGKCFTQEMKRRSEYTFCVQKHLSENRAVYDKIGKNPVQPDKPQMTIKTGACAFRAE